MLRFGLADNDSAPLDSILTNGVYASRDVEKFGAGTLTISGTTSYTGSTTVRRGTLVANGNLTSSSGVFIDRDATLRGTGILPSTTVSGTKDPRYVVTIRDIAGKAKLYLSANWTKKQLEAAIAQNIRLAGLPTGSGLTALANDEGPTTNRRFTLRQTVTRRCNLRKHLQFYG